MSRIDPGPTIDDTHDPERTSWVDPANDPDGDFPIQNLPLGVFSAPSSPTPRIGVAIGTDIVDLEAVHALGLLPTSVTRDQLSGPLDTLLAGGTTGLREIRTALSDLLSAGPKGNALRQQRDQVLVQQSECRLHRLSSVPSFVDFYAGIYHARRAGEIARPGVGLAPNYTWQPVGYNGRASTVRVSGAPVPRPSGPRPDRGDTRPRLAPTAALDFELELGAFVAGTATSDGTLPAVADRIAGLCLLNDWSARDIQRWEMAPLGPFLGKSFATSISPWLVTQDALAPFRVAAMARDNGSEAPLAHLDDPREQASGGYDIDLAVAIQSQGMRDADVLATQIATSNARHLYWTFAQMAAHLSVNGCPLEPGDLIGSGTISGPTDAQSGSLLELTRDATRPLSLTSTETRSYLEDGDDVILTGRCSRDGFAAIGFGECRGRITATGL